ncbi:hypothetical protein GS506_04685 [Rhodococcus hoagii]|nr:hypothetical protein [Prescottella equi]
MPRRHHQRLMCATAIVWAVKTFNGVRDRRWSWWIVAAPLLAVLVPAPLFQSARSDSGQ